MAKINDNFLKLKSGYLFPEINRRVRKFRDSNPDTAIINLGIGDVTQPLAPAVIEAAKKAVSEMAVQKTFRGYGPENGYRFLIDAIIANDFNSRGVRLERSEVFVSDGAKCDTGNIQEIFGIDNTVAVTDPVYPVYVDSNVMAGRTGPADEQGRYQGVVYMPCTQENDFLPELPSVPVDIIYLCFPNNPTGAAADRKHLAKWVEFAGEQNAVILFDAAYEAFISDSQIPHSIYEVEGAEQVAIEFRSYSKTAGFTGLRCAYTVVPKQLKARCADGRIVELNSLWARRHGTKFNGASYISQAAAAAVYTDDGKKQVRKSIDIYMENAAIIRTSLEKLGYTVYGGVNAPYVWMKIPQGLDCWEFFEKLLQRANIVGTPGSGFGAAGEGYFRLSALALPEDVKTASQRFAEI